VVVDGNPILVDINTPRVITRSSDNQMVWCWDNADPFGLTPPNEDPSGSGSSFTYNPRFLGQLFDKETNLYYNYFRNYDPQTGGTRRVIRLGCNEGSIPMRMSMGIWLRSLIR
jgi:uncharacterized protein RhaS with RHS repeats